MVTINLVGFLKFFAIGVIAGFIIDEVKWKWLMFKEDLKEKNMMRYR